VRRNYGIASILRDGSLSLVRSSPFAVAGLSWPLPAELTVPVGASPQAAEIGAGEARPAGPGERTPAAAEAVDE